MRNIRTNHSGFAAVNLLLHNFWVMSMYYMRQHNRPWHISEFEGGINWRRIWFRNLFRALFLSWTPHQLRTEKKWNQTIDNRLRREA